MALMGTLVDNFATADSAKWDYTTPGANATVSNSTLVITCTTGYPTLISQTTYDLTSSAAVLNIVHPANTGNGGTQSYWGPAPNPGSNEVAFQMNNGNIGAQTTISGTQTVFNNTAFNAVTHAWQRIRESGGTTFWETSRDGRSWNSFYSTANPFAITACKAQIGSGFFGTEPTPGTFVATLFNLPPTQPQFLFNRVPVRRASLY
jgi:hypothetical protein